MSVVDCDWGVGIIRRGKQELFNMVKDKKDINKYETFIKYRRHMLNLISAEKFLELTDFLGQDEYASTLIADVYQFMGFYEKENQNP